VAVCGLRIELQALGYTADEIEHCGLGRFRRRYQLGKGLALIASDWDQPHTPASRPFLILELSQRTLL
jgi:hypothetical protein